MLGIGITVLGGAATAGAAWATVKADIKALQGIVNERRMARMERNIVRIGTRLGITTEDPE